MDISNQNSEKSLQLLAAKDARYTSASRLSYLVLISTLIPLGFQVLKIPYPNVGDWENYVSLIGIAAMLFIDRFLKNYILEGTKYYEEFDTELYNIPWNEAVGGSIMSPEDRRRAVGNRILKNYENWYTPATLNTIEHSLAILLCQRQNTRWDMTQKKRFANFMGWILGIGIILLISWGWMAENLTFRVWASTCLFPASAFLTKAWMLLRDFTLVANQQKMLSEDIDAAFAEYKSGLSSISNERLRHFQDRIFEYRNENTIVPGWLYNWFKGDDQKISTEATFELISQIKTR